jgi:hypothetical protein
MTVTALDKAKTLPFARTRLVTAQQERAQAEVMVHGPERDRLRDYWDEKIRIAETEIRICEPQTAIT